jgi:hypothetical protein
LKNTVRPEDLAQMTDDRDDEAPPTVELVAKVFTHVLRMAGRQGIAVDEAQIEPVVKAMLVKEDRWAIDGDFSQAIEAMFALPECLGAYVSPLNYVLSGQVLNDIDIAMGDAEAADRRSNIRMLRKPG